MITSAPTKSKDDVIASIISAIENNDQGQATEIVRQYSSQIDINAGIRIINLSIPKSMLTVIAMTIGELKTKIPPQQAGMLLEKAASLANESVVKCLLTKAKAGQLAIPLESYIQAQINVLNAFFNSKKVSPEMQLQHLKQYFETSRNTYFNLLPTELKARLGNFSSYNYKCSFYQFANIHNMIGSAYSFYTDQVTNDIFSKLDTMNKLTTQYINSRKQEVQTSKSSELELLCKHSIVRDIW
jgi:hypothetical protein